MSSRLLNLEPYDGREVNVVIETVRGSGSKFKYDPERDLFTLHTVLPQGSAFPYDYGFIPSTRGEDGDPLDVLVLMDSQVFPGCLVYGRLIGVLDAVQKEKGKADRNPRLIAVERRCVTWSRVDRLHDLPAEILRRIEHFFVSYNEMRGTEFVPKGRRGPDAARKRVKEGARRFHKAAQEAEG